MAKKKREHIVFDQMLRIRKRMPISKVNSEGSKVENDKKNLKRKQRQRRMNEFSDNYKEFLSEFGKSRKMVCHTWKHLMWKKNNMNLKSMKGDNNHE